MFRTYLLHETGWWLYGYMLQDVLVGMRADMTAKVTKKRGEGRGEERKERREERERGGGLLFHCA